MFGKGKKIFYRIGEESICPISCKIKFFQVLEEIKLREFVTHIRKKLEEELLFLLQNFHKKTREFQIKADIIHKYLLQRVKAKSKINLILEASRKSDKFKIFKQGLIRRQMWCLFRIFLIANSLKIQWQSVSINELSELLKYC